MARNPLAIIAIVVLLVGGCLVVPLSPASAHAAASASDAATGSLTVAATKDYGYLPSTFQQVPTNATITVTFTDDDVLQHSFVISSREGFVIPTGYTDTQLAQLFVTVPGALLLGGQRPGRSSRGKFPFARHTRVVRVRLQCDGPFPERNVRFHCLRREPPLEPHPPLPRRYWGREPQPARRGGHRRTRYRGRPRRSTLAASSRGAESALSAGSTSLGRLSVGFMGARSPRGTRSAF